MPLHFSGPSTSYALILLKVYRTPIFIYIYVQRFLSFKLEAKSMRIYVGGLMKNRDFLSTVIIESHLKFVMLPSHSYCNIIICHSCSQVHCVDTTVQMDRWTHRHCSILVWAHRRAWPVWWATLTHALMRKVHWLVTWRVSVWTTTQAVYTTLAEATVPRITHRQILLVSPRHWKEVG